MIWTTSRLKNKTCQRVEELLVSQRPSISSTQLSADVLLQLGYFLLGGWWQDLHSGHRKTHHSTKHSRSIKKISQPTPWEYLLCSCPLQGSSPDDGIGAKPAVPPNL